MSDTIQLGGFISNTYSQLANPLKKIFATVKPPFKQESLLSTDISESSSKSFSFTNLKLKKKRLSFSKFNTGRWSLEEHKRFIEAILQYGNDWRLVQSLIGSRSSSQARSHAQKFFMKIKETSILDLELDFSKNTIKELQEIASKIDHEQLQKTKTALSTVAFEKASKIIREQAQRKQKNAISTNRLDYLYFY